MNSLKRHHEKHPYLH